MKLKIFILLICLFSLLSCGIDEYYYLPQMPHQRIITISNTEAVLELPAINQYYYALNYTIFYRIYISGQNVDSFQISNDFMNSINTNLTRDFNAIYPSTDPTNTTASTAVNSLFRSRNYFELEIEGADIKSLLSLEGASLNIRFPTAQWGIPHIIINGAPYNLRRSSQLISPEPSGDLFFRNTSGLNAPENAIDNKNADVSPRTGVSQRFAYVSMYIVAVGIDPDLFTPIYSKPTHISVFKLPDT